MNPISLITDITESARNLKNIRTLTLASILSALYAISMTPFIGNITIIPGKVEIRFGFLLLAIAGMYLGPVPAILVAMVGDLVGTVLFYGGEFFFGYTITWMIQAFVFGLIFYKRTPSLPRVLFSMVFSTLVINLLLTTYWQSYLFGTPFFTLLVTRIPLNAIMLLPKTGLLYLVLKSVESLRIKANFRIN